MDKKTVLITGAGGNLGKVTVTYFLNQGWRVIASVSPGKSLSGFTGKDLHVYAIDLTDEEAVAGWIAALLNEFGQLHAALLLAGGYTSGSVAGTSAADLRRMYSLNFETAYYVARPVFLHMQQHQAGRIIFIGSKPALEIHPGGNALAYALSKAQLLKLAEYLHAEGKEQHVAAYCVVPEIIDTPDNRKAMPNADFSRWIKPEKMAEVMFRLCDDKTLVTESVVKLYKKS